MIKKKFTQSNADEKAIGEITLPVVDAAEFWADPCWTQPLDKTKKKVRT